MSTAHPLQVERRTHRLRSHAPSFTKSKSRPGVPTIIRVVLPSLLAFLSVFTWGALSTPPKTATLAIPNGSPSSKRVSCVWMASSRVGATTNTETVVVPLFFCEEGTGEAMSCERAGSPNARVFPLCIVNNVERRGGVGLCLPACLCNSDNVPSLQRRRPRTSLDGRGLLEALECGLKSSGYVELVEGKHRHDGIRAIGDMDGDGVFCEECVDGRGR